MRATPIRQGKLRNARRINLLLACVAAVMILALGRQSDAVTNSIMHNSSTANTKGYWSGKWGVAGGQYGQFTCSTCHSTNTANIKRIVTSIPATIGVAVNKSVVFTNVTGLNSFGDDSTTPNYTSSTRVCEVCHTQTIAHRYDNSAAGVTQKPNHMGGSRQDCISCHKHNKGFSASCSSCHGYPPVTTGQLATVPAPTYALGNPAVNEGAHARHAQTENMACATCHANNTTGGHPGATVRIGFQYNNTNWAKLSGPLSVFSSYTGNNTAGAKPAGSSDVNTVVGNKAAIDNSCGVYCHGNWPGSGAVRPAWTDIGAGGSGACGKCHGASASAPPTRASHPTHAGNGSGQYRFACTTCHPSVTNSSHIQGNVQWRLSSATGSVVTPGATYRGSANGSTGAIAPSASYGTCSGLYCHSSGATIATVTAPRTVPTWGTALGCNDCHGNSTATLTTGSHPKHVASAGCDKCHALTAANANALKNVASTGYHVNGQINIAFEMNSSATSGAQYGGVSTPRAKTPDNGASYGSCTNITCHNNGQSVWLGTTGAGTTPQWGNAAAGGCGACHGNTGGYTDYRKAAPLYADGSPKPNSHQFHVDTRTTPVGETQCKHCHASVTASNTAINGTSPANHANNAYNVVAGSTYTDGDNAGGAAVAVTANYTYSGTPNSSSCSNVSCHPTGLAGTKAASSVKWNDNYACIDCHNVNLTATTSYHHAMRNYSSTYQNGVPSGSADNGTNAVNRRCTMCHLDHNVFSPALSNGAGTRAGNLRTNIASTTGAGSDFIKSASEGICISCHKNTLTKDTTKIMVDGNSTTVVVTLDTYSSSAHQYNVTSTMSNGGAVFNANCSKCHNGRTGEVALFQSRSTAVHDSGSRHVLGALGAATPGQFQEENFCYRCHSKAADAIGGVKKSADANDWYGAKTDMTATSTAIYQLFQKTSKHPVASYSNKHDAVETAAASFSGTQRHVECEDCHNPHQATMAAPLRGATGLDPTSPAAGSTPTYTMVTVTAPDQQYKVCFKCHTDWAGYGTGTTNLAVDFNTSNDSFHWVENDKYTYTVNSGTGKGIWKNAQFNLNAVPTQGTKKYVEVMMPRTGITYDNATLRTLPLRCSDCHGSDGADGGVNVPEGPHGSTIANILKVPAGSPYTTWNATTSSLTGDTWCLNCHDPAFGNSGFIPSNGHLYGGSGKHQRACQFCHLAIPHGSGSEGAGAANQRKHLLKPTTFTEGIDSETSGNQNQHGTWVIPGCT